MPEDTGSQASGKLQRYLCIITLLLAVLLGGLAVFSVGKYKQARAQNDILQLQLGEALAKLATPPAAVICEQPPKT